MDMDVEDATKNADNGTDDYDANNPPLVLTSAKPRGVYECDYCHSDISRMPRIRCAECLDFDLCLDCFLTTDHTTAIARLRASVEAGKKVQGRQGSTENDADNLTSSWHSASGAIHHDDSHGYRVCDNTRYPMFPGVRKVAPRGSEEDKKNQEKDQDGDVDMKDDAHEIAVDTNTLEKATTADNPVNTVVPTDVVLIPDDVKAIWTVEEDLRLLEGIESHGLGNWSDIAEVVAGVGSAGKNPRRCMERYFDDFLGRYGHILPPYTLVEDASATEEGGNVYDNANNKDGMSTPVKEAPSETASIGAASIGSVTKDVDPTRLSKRKHAIASRSNVANSTVSLQRFNRKVKIVPTESLPEYKVVSELYPNPAVPDKVSSNGVPNPPVVAGQEVGRDQSVKGEQLFVRAISSLPKEEADKIRKEWQETRYMKQGGPTVLPARAEDVVQLPGAELAGYMPRRGDFDIEWENDAEQALADMEFLPGDLEEDKRLKLAVLKIYNEKLDERQKRKDFIRERNLHDYRKNQEEDAKLPRDERDLVRRMRLFERFHSPAEHKKFLEDILKAKRLRKEIAKFQMYRRLGITSLAEAEKYELDKSRRNFHKVASLQKEANKKAAPAAETMSTNSAAGGKDDRPDESINSLWYQYNNKSVSRHQSDSRSDCVDANAAQGVEANTDGTDEKEEGSKSAATDKDVMKIAGDDDAKESDRKNSDGDKDDFHVEKMEWAGLLSKKEQDLCRRLRLTPKQYIEIKNVLITESLNKGLLDKDSNGKRTLFMLDIEKRGDVITFMMKAGWLDSKGGTMARRLATDSK